MAEAKDVAQERTIGLGVLAVQDDMRTTDHRVPLCGASLYLSRYLSRVEMLARREPQLPGCRQKRIGADASPRGRARREQRPRNRRKSHAATLPAFHLRVTSRPPDNRHLRAMRAGEPLAGHLAQ